MRIKSFSYKDVTWEVNGLQLKNINLIVGSNAVGKTRTLNCIDSLAKIVTQKEAINWGGEWTVIFENYKREQVEYSFSTSSKTKGVTFEKIIIDGELAMSRDSRYHDGAANIKNAMNRGAFERVYPPKDKLVVHTNRDTKRYPFLESIANWAERSYGFKFGNISPYSFLNEQKYDFLTTVEEIPELWRSLDKEKQEEVKQDINQLGYTIEKLSVQNRGGLKVLMIKEEQLERSIAHYHLSQGMFRSIALVIYVHYLLSIKKPSTIIIDDLCEGLDYARATKLGKFLFNTIKESNVQLIATSNDSFLMDVIDIEYWNVLFRDGKVISSINEQSHPEIFEKFKFTGLSNFGFFSSSYLTSKLASK